MIVRILLGLALLGHGLIHIGYLTPDPDDPRYPFTLDDSWLLPSSVRRGVGSALAIITVVAFAALALAAWGVPSLDSMWSLLIVVGGSASLILLVAFWHPWIVVGIVVDVSLLVLTLAVPGWWDRVLT